jgi:hypothetical protein
MAHDDARCAVCSVTVHMAGARACPTCGVLYHRDCWDWIGSCSIFGCAGGPAGPSVLRPRWVDSRPPPPFSLRRFLIHNVVAMVIPVMVVGLIFCVGKSGRSREDLAFLGAAVCALYVFFGPLFDSRHPFTYSARRTEDGFLKTRIVLSMMLAFTEPAAWVMLVVVQAAFAVCCRRPRRQAAAS